MTWESKNKALDLTVVTPHSACPHPDIEGRAPDVFEIHFTPHELYGAMARSSNLHVINPDAVTFESETCRHLVAQHVDDGSDGFFILPSADNLKDFSRTHMVGVVGAGIAYLQMVRDGYVWCDHFENLALDKPVSTKRSPDFVFCRPGEASVAISESKATRGSSRAQFDGTVKRGYLEQVSPYLGFKLSGAVASHGFSIGSWMTSRSRAELLVHHTAIATGKPTGPGALSNPGSVKRGNYLTVLSLMFGAAIATAAREGRWTPGGGNFLIAKWLGRDWLLGSPVPYFAGRRWPVPGAFLRTHGDWSMSPIVNEFALELSIARTFFRSLAALSGGYDLLADLPTIDEGLIGRAKEAGGAVYPDGLAVLGNTQSLEHLRVSPWDPEMGEFANVNNTPIEKLESEPSFGFHEELREGFLEGEDGAETVTANLFAR